jgi:transposase
MRKEKPSAITSSTEPLNVYIGFDISKDGHYVAILCPPIFKEHRRYTAIPAHRIGNNRTEFEKLYQDLEKLTSPDRCFACLERTGHYGFALEQFLLERGIQVYRVQASKTIGDKTDKRDAQRLALAAYNQLELHARVSEPSQEVRRLVPPQPIFAFLRPLVHHRAELVREQVRRKNQLTALVDEAFPEFVQIYKNPNTRSALQMRLVYPTPEAMLAASVDDLCAARLYKQPSRVKLIELQELARRSIGVKGDRLRSLVIEQAQLIECLQLLYRQIDEVEAIIEETITSTREGQILMSFSGVGPINAAILMSHIDCIAHFERASKLRSYLGWAPRREQTGTSKDQTILPKRKGHLLKATVYLIVFASLKSSLTWQVIYEQYCKKLCPLDANGEYLEKKRAMARCCNRVINLMYMLLKRDYDLVTSWSSEEPLPAPELYDAKKHLEKITAHTSLQKVS